MASGFKVKFYWYQIGNRDFISVFSYALEKAKEVNAEIEIKSM